MRAQLPENESERLRALEQCGILDTLPEEDFDGIVSLAAQICGVPIAAISLIDRDRQWFKAILGIPVSETARDVAFCAHTILQPDLLVVPDAQADPRFADNPLVTGDPNIRFYAGAPLITTEGHALGSLCVIDRAHRVLTKEQQAALRVLARQVCAQLELRRRVEEHKQQVEEQKLLLAERTRAQDQLQEYAERFEAAIGAMQDGLVVRDAGGGITVCNAAAERILGMTAEQMAGRTSLDPGFRTIREDGSDLPAEEHPSLHSLRTGETMRGVVLGVHRPDGDLAWVSVNTAPLLRPGQARPAGVVATIEDVTERKAAETANARLAAIVDASPDAVTALTLDGTIVSWSPGAERVYGYAASEVIGQHASLLAGPGQASPVPEALKRLRRGEEVPPVEVVRRRKDGSCIDVLLTFTPIRNAAGELIGVAGIGRDITVQKKAVSELQTRRQFQDALLESLSEGIVACDAEGALSLFNRATREFHGLPEQPLPPDRWTEHFDLFQADGVTPMSTEDVPLFRAFRGETVRDAEIIIAPKSGTPRTLLASGQAILGERGEKLGAVVAMHDITGRKASEEALRRAEEKYRGIFENAIDGIFQTSPEGRPIRANPSLAQMLGYESPEQLIENLTDLRQQLYVDPADRDRFLTLLREHGSVVGFEAQFRRKDGSILWTSMNARLVIEGGLERYLEGTIEDCTARREAEEKVRDYGVVLETKMVELAAANAELERLATTDGLTGLTNNRAFRQRLSEEFQRANRYQTPLSLLLLDVDRFKQYNDSFGHPAGDAVLRQVAQVVAVCARETDVVARYGGEEFVLVLPHTDAQGALVIAERIRIAVAAAPWDLRGVTVSVGVATIRMDIPNPDLLIACADDALYRSKAEGRNRITHHRTSLAGTVVGTETPFAVSSA